MKKILFVNRVSLASEGATARVMQDAMRAFRDAGWQADAISTHGRAGSMRDYAIAWFKLFRKLIRAGQYDVIMLMTDPPFLVWQILFWPFSHGTKLVYWAQDLYPDLLPAMNYRFAPWPITILQHITTYAANRCDAVIAIGHCMKERLIANGVAAERIVVIPNWAPQQLAPLPHLPQHHLRVLYAGNFGLNHPFDALLEAAEHFRQDSRIHFTFSGRGKRRAHLAEQIALRNLKNCTLRDFVSDDQLNSLLAGGDVHVTTMADAALGMLVPCKVYSAPAVQRYSLFIGPRQSEAAQYIQANNLGCVLPHDSAELIMFLNDILHDRAAFDQRVHNIIAPASSLPSLVSYIEKLAC